MRWATPTVCPWAMGSPKSAMTPSPVYWFGTLEAMHALCHYLEAALENAAPLPSVGFFRQLH